MYTTEQTGLFHRSILTTRETSPSYRLKKNQVVDHSPTGFQRGYSGSETAQLAATILNEITDDLELTKQHYQFFKFDHVTKWEGLTLEISEQEVRNWLRYVGAQVAETRQTQIKA